MLLLKKNILPVFMNSLPQDHYAQRTGQNFQERGIMFFSHEVTKRKCNDHYSCNHQVYSTHEFTDSKCSDYY